MKEINYRAIEKMPITIEVMNMISVLHEYKGRQELYIETQPEILERLMEVARIQSTEASNKIEGIYTSDKRLREIVQKKRMLSGIKPSGDLTLGSYLGAVKNWAERADQYDCFYFMADLHAITVRQNPADLRRRTLEQLAQYIACGLDPEKKVYDLFATNYIPRNYIIDKEGNIAAIGLGYEPAEFDELVKKVEELLNE